MLLLDVDNEHGRRQAAHFHDAAKDVGELFFFAREIEAFAFGEILDGTFVFHLFDLLQALERFADRREIGEHAARPAVDGKKLPGAFRFLL